MNKKFLQVTTVLWQKIALVFLGLILSLLLLEAGMRLGGFVLLSIQEYGNLQATEHKGAYRILCLGESTTQGQYPRLLERALNHRNIGVRFSVIDKGEPATNSTAILSRVGSYLTEYHPDMVVTMMGINDEGRHMPLEMLTPSGRKSFIRSLRIYKLARLLWLHISIKAKEMGVCQPDDDKRSSGAARTPLPETGSKEASDEPVSTEGPLKKTGELDSGKGNTYVELGRLSLEQGKFPQAEGLFKKAIALNPQNDQAYVGLGWLYQAQGGSRQSEDFFKKAIEINPENAKACAGLGRLYRIQGEFSKAEVLLKKATEIDPKSVFAFFELGALYREQGQLSQAEAVLKKSFEINPKVERALGAMASLYEEMGKPELAKEYAEKAARSGLELNAAVTVSNYRKLKEILDRKGIRLVCVQYPMRNAEPLKRIFVKNKGVIFVDNESIFKEAVKKGGYKEYFKDMFGGDFGHCTQKGNELLAHNITEVILREVFDKS